MTNNRYFHPGILLWWCLAPFIATGCSMAGYDERIAQLKDEITSERLTLSSLAEPFRVAPGRDFQFDVTARPLIETIEKFNSLDERVFWVGSYDFSGNLDEDLSNCRWPFSGQWGYYMKLFDGHSFAATFSIDHITPQWSVSGGLNFRLKSTFGSGYLFGWVGEAVCVIKTDIAPFAALFVSWTNSATGYTTIEPKPGEGLGYSLELDQPLYFGLWLVSPVYSQFVVLPLQPTLTKGTLRNLVGKEGDVSIGKNGSKRRYMIDVNFDHASFLPGGLSVAGPLIIRWVPSDTSNLSEAGRGGHL